MRNEVSKQIEVLRVAGDIGSALDAKVELFANQANFDLLSSLGDELRFVLMTSEAVVSSIDQANGSAVASDIEGLSIAVSALKNEKCVRCWHRRPDIASHAEHPELCGRCIENIDGEGEVRLHA